jgi:F-type H+-transporting ATPase subunit gamma
MQSLKEIRKKIVSVHNIWKLTSALETLSVVKMKKAQKLALSSRPFAQKVAQLLVLVKEMLTQQETIFLKEGEGNSLFLVVTSDRRFCGNFNQNILKFAQKEISKIEKEEKDAEIFPVGKVGSSFFLKRGYKIKYQLSGIGDFGELEEVKPISDFLIKSFLERRFKKIFLIFSHFKSVFSSEVKKIQLLPLRMRDLEIFLEKAEIKREDFIIEPSKEYLLEEICPQLVEYIIYQAVLESNASEHAARMLAMKQASENAKEKFEELLLSYHKIRQGLITAETSEIFSAKEVLEKYG